MLNQFLSTQRRGHGGLLLLLLIGVALGLFLMFGSFGGKKSYVQNAVDTKDKAEQTVSMITIKSMTDSIVAYELANGRPPADVNELAEGAPMSAFEDPWGNVITFEIRKEPSGGRTAVFTSAGPDAQPGTEDDIVEERPLPL